jgi:hypothetical protein
MTPGELALWRAVYAASWHQPTGAPMGLVGDEMRASWAAIAADRALEALRALGEGPGDRARVVREVLE